MRPSLAKTFGEFRSSVSRAGSLVDRADQFQRSNGLALLERDREEIVTLAFLKLGLAWETFLEESFLKYLCGAPSVTGTNPNLIGGPFQSLTAAKAAVFGGQAYVSWARQPTIQRANVYFQGGGPYANTINGIASELRSFTDIRNRIAHRSDSARTKFRNEVTQRLGYVPRGTTPGRYLRMNFAANLTGYKHFQAKLDAAATLIAQ